MNHHYEFHSKLGKRRGGFSSNWVSDSDFLLGGIFLQMKGVSNLRETKFGRQ